MAITKEIIQDKIEIVGDYKTIQIREATVIKEDGVEISRSFQRRALNCITSTKNGDTWTHTETDVSKESTEIKGIAAALWTTEIKNANKASNEANQAH